MGMPTQAAPACTWTGYPTTTHGCKNNPAEQTKLLQTTDNKTADNTKSADFKADELLALLEIESAGKSNANAKWFSCW